MGSRKLRARITSSTPVAGGFLRVNRYEFETERHDGGMQTVVREVMERGHSVGVLGYDPRRDEVVLVNEFRPGCLIGGDDPYTDNVVAGMVGEHETPLQAAAREMQEEAGLELRDAVLVHPGAYVSSGGTSEKIAIVAGFVDTAGAGGIHGNPSETEDTLVVVLDAATFMDRVRRAEITDLKTLVAGYWLIENRRRLRAQRRGGKQRKKR